MEGEKVAILRTPLSYVLASGEVREADAGTMTDGTSLPAITWPLFGHPFDSAHCRESIVHDHGYQKAPPADGSLMTIWRSMFSKRRRDEDLAYLEALRANPKLPDMQAEAMWFGVRLLGWWPWCRHARYNALVAKQEITSA